MEYVGKVRGGGGEIYIVLNCQCDAIFTVQIERRMLVGSCVRAVPDLHTSKRSSAWGPPDSRGPQIDK